MRNRIWSKRGSLTPTQKAILIEWRDSTSCPDYCRIGNVKKKGRRIEATIKVLEEELDQMEFHIAPPDCPEKVEHYTDIQSTVYTFGKYGIRYRITVQPVNQDLDWMDDLRNEAFKEMEILADRINQKDQITEELYNRITTLIIREADGENTVDLYTGMLPEYREQALAVGSTIHTNRVEWQETNLHHILDQLDRRVIQVIQE